MEHIISRYKANKILTMLSFVSVVRISPFANRLTTSIPPHIQFLRCLANYKALRFSSTITNLAKKIVSRMADKSLTSGGKYVAVHLRFEEVLLNSNSFVNIFTIIVCNLNDF